MKPYYKARILRDQRCRLRRQCRTIHGGNKDIKASASDTCCIWSRLQPGIAIGQHHNTPAAIKPVFRPVVSLFCVCLRQGPDVYTRREIRERKTPGLLRNAAFVSPWDQRLFQGAFKRL